MTGELMVLVIGLGVVFALLACGYVLSLHDRIRALRTDYHHAVGLAERCQANANRWELYARLLERKYKNGEDVTAELHRLYDEVSP